jgi:hypothetical protein
MDNINQTNTTNNQDQTPDAGYLAAEKAKEASKTVIAYAKEKPDMAALFVLGVLNLFS